jgi:type I site-specific restriction endonuclease
MSTEADTCRKYVFPKLLEAGWDNDPHSFTEQRTFTDGRIVVSGDKIRRKKQKRADYLLRYTRDFPIAVIEAKPDTYSNTFGRGNVLSSRMGYYKLLLPEFFFDSPLDFSLCSFDNV